MSNLFEKYDSTNPKSIEDYAQKLKGHTFEDILSWNKGASKVDENSISYGNLSRKGGLGNLLEEQFFGYKANSLSEADFPDAGVELKVTPYEKKKNGDLRAGERLVLGMISYEAPIENDFYNSHVWEKCKLILLVYYWRNRLVSSNLKYQIDFVKLFTPPQEDLSIIQNDYKIITQKIQAGRAHELSEGDTMYLGACTKGSTAEKSTVPQFYSPHGPARKRAFCYKTSYMTYVLNKYIASHTNPYEPIIKDAEVLKRTTFEEYIETQINQYAGKSDKELCAILQREYNNNKAQWIELAYRMLGIKSNRAEEFVKANIVVKAIRLDKSGKMKENSPLPTIHFKELIREEWEDSELFSYLHETKFLFVVYKKSGDQYLLKGCQLWNMPYTDLNEIVHEGWRRIKATVEDGIEFKLKQTKGGIEVKNNLPSKSENPIVHIRPHTSKRFYRLGDGEIIGNGTYTNGDQLPDGRWMTLQSFWLNNTYIVSQLKEELK